MAMLQRPMDGAPGDVAQLAHKMISSASILELDDLAKACQAFKQSCRKGGSVVNAFRYLAPEIDIAIGRIDRRLFHSTAT